jgi:4-deoxy-L-threo-5-hexosulose-uronate ketol-isomerase
MDVRYLPNHESYRHLTTTNLRESFVVESLFTPGSISMVYCETDRSIIGGALPIDTPLTLIPTRKEMAADFFTERREVGVVNIGGEGTVRVNSTEHTLRLNDVLYIGRGKKEIEFRTRAVNQSAHFYFISYPAHTDHPDSLIHQADAEKVVLGSAETANKRTINKYIHTNGVKSCQLVMGLTQLDTGSIWNTMPPHTHMRRSEVYLYYAMEPDDLVVHLMGMPDETRSLIMRNRQAVISPSWSIHCGAGTRAYSFVWAMGGENQEFSDMDVVAMKDLR